VPDALPLDSRARQIFQYFKTYNYDVKDKGEVITFVGNLQGQHWPGISTGLVYLPRCAAHFLMFVPPALFLIACRTMISEIILCQ
jgi:hypothetical protein